MASRNVQGKPLAGGVRTLRLLGLAFLTMVVAAAACGKVKTSDTIGPDGVDDANYTIFINLPAASVPPGGQLNFTVTAKDQNGNAARDNTTLFLVGDALGTVTPGQVSLVNGLASATFNAGQTEGTSTIQAKYDDSSTISATVKIEKDAPPPPPGGGGGGDPIDLSQVSWVDADPSGYPVNATISGVHFKGRPDHVCWDALDYPDDWPPFENRAGEANANQSVFAFYNGRWYSGCWEALTPSYRRAACRILEAVDRGENCGPFCQVENYPFNQWYPKSGEQIGFMMSTWIRNYKVPNGPKGRSNVVMATWP